MGECFMEQVKNICNVVKKIYNRTTHTCAFTFDQSSYHKKFSKYALQAKKILVKGSGERRVRDTIWAGWPQAMVHSDSTAKGLLKMIMQERGINPSTLKADNMRTILSNHDDFLNEKTEVEHYIEGWGFLCLFLPKFHRELNPTDRVWGQSKHYYQAYSNFTI